MYFFDSSLEVVIIINLDGDYDGYLELIVVVKVMLFFFSNGSLVVWINVVFLYKLIKNNKNYIYVFGLFKYLLNYNLNNKKCFKEYYIFKLIISDLFMGV